MAWTLYKEVKYATDGIPPANLTDFPVPVWIDADADIAAELSGGGGIKFTNAAGTVDLAFGLYPDTDLATGYVHARVKLSPLTAANVGDVICRIYYDSGETTVEDKAGTVSNGYELFMPLEEDPSGSAPQMYDWVTESNVGTSSGSMTSGDLVAATVDNGLDFDGSDDVITVSGNPLNGATEFTIEAHVRTPNVGFNSGVMCNNNDSGGGGDGWELKLNGDASAKVQFVRREGFTGSSILSDSALSNDTWYHCAGVAEAGGTVSMYINGAVQAATTSTSGTLGNTTNTIIGTNAGRTHIVDEVRLSSVARSADWLEYTHTTDFNLADLWTLSAEQGGGGGGNRRRRVLLTRAA